MDSQGENVRFSAVDNVSMLFLHLHFYYSAITLYIDALEQTNHRFYNVQHQHSHMYESLIMKRLESFRPHLSSTNHVIRYYDNTYHGSRHRRWPPPCYFSWRSSSRLFISIITISITQGPHGKGHDSSLANGESSCEPQWRSCSQGERHTPRVEMVHTLTSTY